MAAAETASTVAEIAGSMDGRPGTNGEMSRDDPNEIAAVREAMLASLDSLYQKTVMIFGERSRRWQSLEAQMKSEGESWSGALRTGDSAKASAALQALRKEWTAMKMQYPREALEVLPPLWTCPMHSELIEPATGTCPICGMSLEPIYITQPQLIQGPIIHAEIVTTGPLVVGKESQLRLRLFLWRNRTHGRFTC